MEFKHRPVLLDETLAGLNLRAGGTYVDATLGGGGHARAIVEEIQPGGILIGIDRDREALNAAKEALEDLSALFIPVRDTYANLRSILAHLGIKGIHGILFDLGVSSYQLDNPARGFSYMEDGPLDMRMDQTQEVRARDLVNTLSEKDLTRIIREFGEERWSGRIARLLVRARQKEAIETTGQLVEIVKKAIPARARRTGGHPARRTFQALRIAVNGELDTLVPALTDAVDLLHSGGRVAVITFHSLEDRLVKRAFIKMEGGCICPPGMPRCGCGSLGLLKIVNRKPMVAGEEEIRQNNRARSAKLRIAEKRQVLKEKEGE